jgi:hypothetical protein
VRVLRVEASVTRLSSVEPLAGGSIKGGRLVFGYFPSRQWLADSSYLNP